MLSSLVPDMSGVHAAGKERQMAAAQPMRLVVEGGASGEHDDAAVEAVVGSSFAQQASSYAQQVRHAICS